MAKQSISSLLGRASQVKDELILGANTATRIGKLLLDILASVATEWDPTRPYEPGENIIWHGRIVRAYLPTKAGQSPTTDPDLWIDDVIDSGVKLSTTGDNFPVLAQAMKDYVTKAISDSEGNGGGTPLTKADTQMLADGVNDSAYVTPKGVAFIVERIIDFLANHTDLPSLVGIGNAATNDEVDAFAGRLIAKMKTETVQALCAKLTAAGCGGTTLPGTATYRFRNFKHYVFVDSAVIVTPPVLTPVYMGRFDANNCDEFSGWFVDINNPNAATSVRIERDGIVIARIAATRVRDDVRLSLINQQKLAADVTFNIYGFVYAKTSADKDGQPHKFEAFGGTSQTKATTDVGAPATVTCGSVVVNPNPNPATNNPPRIVGTYTDQEVYAAGDQLLGAITGLFADDDALTYSATMGDGSPLMAGISFTPGDAKPFKILATFPNQQQPIYIIATDTAGNSTKKIFLLTVARPVANPNPATLVSRAFGGDTETVEGNGARVKIINTLSNNAQSDYTGGGTYRIIAPYPDQMVITTDANAVGVITTQETVVADVEVTLEFKFPDETTITGKFLIRNKVAASSPVTGQLIDNIRVVEGNQGVVQVYDSHADGSWSEVTQADGSRFELVAPYPNGMSLSWGNTGRALVQTAGNSVTADVDVTVRFIYANGQVVTGTITVQNLDTTTPTNPTTPTDPNVLFIDKMAIYYPYAWRNDVRPGHLSENLVLLINVAGTGGKDAKVMAQFAESRNDASFGMVSKLDYSKNNVPPNILPNGYTHFTYFNDEQFSVALRTFRARITSVANSQVQGVYQAPSISPDHTTAQIYPVSN